MVASLTGLNKPTARTIQRGGPLSGSDFVTSIFQPMCIHLVVPDVLCGARSRAFSSFRQAVAMAYKEAKPQTFVRIIALFLARVM
ncbi:hypothetical protein WP7S18C02_29500 [Klebsiella sp. WP7-S18-CRE-02]|uniref:hypothetical protein n=1 Tax=unclassified Klebsiella TaxID=2608929 RepID=UPI0015DD48CE|nr:MULTISPECIES: hypothetical protein [unclassified Klebsiella]BBR58373.1 hypothetical protein WP4W18E05_17410 [Klebsiella sp. WP4-W18-ESBL-05]BBS92335.1 hypothetical protein WP7S18C02_29500 [Klebsiella sp. WP7-S18-CRE-02]BBS97365.1 hypothetical protein WP7S18C03_29580 [Klebsiella sp. WP7-S18-CRE-03]BBT02432.1 hypothetical protein WP7S18E04_29940 [Klebsiella sp. WP7-S18-ESBL-04]